ncbi:alpha/beta hydrolase fold domain-containing protein [Streptomyces sp. NPDC102462]|uniref:alpha/beta hydrolase fold domain-containing protein n=1 Tax=Streptomyces sp. NPDC102462 TaxID=3366178 RepID=UPI0037FD03A1
MARSCWAFLEAGFVVASVDYRLSGECRFPEPVHDLAAAVRRVRANAAEHGLDPDRIVGLGPSAGGYLVSAIGLAPDNAVFAGAGADARTLLGCRDGTATRLGRRGRGSWKRHAPGDHVR